MVRPPIGPTSMTHVVKFRVREDEYQKILRIAQGRSISTTMREILSQYAKKDPKHPERT